MSEQTPEPTFAWEDFFELAAVLAERGDEASQRSAVSRAYYAVFNVAQSVLEAHDPNYNSMRSRDSHKQVWDRLRALDRRQARSAERSGRSLLNKRKSADYTLGLGDWPNRTKQALVEAKRALASLNDLLEP